MFRRVSLHRSASLPECQILINRIIDIRDHSPETWPDSPSTSTPDYLYTVLLAKSIELDAYYNYPSSSPGSSTPSSIEDINNDQMHDASTIPSSPSASPASPMSTSLVAFDQDRLPQSQAIMGRDAQKYRQAIACWFPIGTSWAEPELEVRAGFRVPS
jgi:hypothetical protein